MVCGGIPQHPLIPQGQERKGQESLGRLEKDSLNSIIMDIKELAKAHLLSFMALAFGSRAKLKDGKRIVELDWDEFQRVFMDFYELGRDDGVNITKAVQDGTDKL